MPKHLTAVEIGQRVWVAYEDSNGTVVAIDEWPANGVNVLLDSDGVTVSCAFQQLFPTR